MSSDSPRESFAALFEQSARGAPRKRAPKVGETVDGVVVQVGKDAVFVDLDGRQQGFIESIDLRAPDGAMNVAVGARIRVRVMRVDPDGIRLTPTVEAAVAAGASVSLGAAGLVAPGEAPAAVKIAVGQIVGGTVDRVENYGIFLQIDGTKGRAGRG